ncbi:hypothetical protein [Xanthomonas euroxanthea]|uniref:hypothetical protein n=1 Tax=Xanthomonas euroxanthea TaxID=2259622 RepID=UPI0016095175|nr:hypothetical protein [Xanthomonas euroxanthea]MBB5769104.1 hypothetical protein [Xanthomonas euroxanthea]
MRKLLIAATALAVLAVIASTQITIFVIQPIGALPEGRTLVILRLNKTEFIDSADAMCEREMGSVNLICRIGMMGAVAEKSTILLRLPFSQSLYDLSTGGKHYDR